MTPGLSPLGAASLPCSLLIESLATAVGAPWEAATVRALSSSAGASAVGTGYHHASDVVAVSPPAESNAAVDDCSRANEDMADA